jgi:hypothetical protein
VYGFTVLILGMFVDQERRDDLEQRGHDHREHDQHGEHRGQAFPLAVPVLGRLHVPSSVFDLLADPLLRRRGSGGTSTSMSL